MSHARRAPCRDVAAPPAPSSPAYVAGLEEGDVLLSVGGMPANSAEDVTALLASHKPGDAVAVRYRQRGVE
ncbi:PDZ domain-containing protein, partial [Mycobacterium tuberculosis]